MVCSLGNCGDRVFSYLFWRLRINNIINRPPVEGICIARLGVTVRIGIKGILVRNSSKIPLILIITVG